MTQLTLQLSEEIARQATTLAALHGQAVEDYLAGIVTENVAADPEAELKQLASLSDEDILALADLKLSPVEDRRLHELLEWNSENRLTKDDKRELDELMKIHDEAMLKKALGWAEAVRRKLRPPISP